VNSRFISAVALYGPKAEPLRSSLTEIQALIAGHIGGGFRPYSLDQIHATLIALNGVRDPQTGVIINEYYLEHTGAGLEMDLERALRILAAQLPLRVRIGGYRKDEAVPFVSRGQHLFERTFSVQANAFVLIGWPSAPSAPSVYGRPLDRLRREMNAANVLHRYHQCSGDIDDDFYLVVGHHDGDAADEGLESAVGAVRKMLSVRPIDLEIRSGDVKVVAADSHTLAPPLFVSGIPVDGAALRALM
jgi:hypothetical protein